MSKVRKPKKKLTNPRHTAKLSVSIDRKLLQEVEKELTQRGSDVQTYIKLHIRALSRAKTMLSLRDKLTFGKFAGELVEDVVRTEPQYMCWIISVQQKTKFAPDVLALLEELSS